MTRPAVLLFGDCVVIVIEVDTDGTEGASR